MSDPNTLDPEASGVAMLKDDASDESDRLNGNGSVVY